MNWNSSTVKQRSQTAPTLRLETGGLGIGAGSARLNQLWQKISNSAMRSMPIQPAAAARELVAL